MPLSLALGPRRQQRWRVEEAIISKLTKFRNKTCVTHQRRRGIKHSTDGASLVAPQVNKTANRLPISSDKRGHKVACISIFRSETLYPQLLFTNVPGSGRYETCNFPSRARLSLLFSFLFLYLFFSISLPPCLPPCLVPSLLPSLPTFLPYLPPPFSLPPPSLPSFSPSSFPSFLHFLPPALFPSSLPPSPA